jgi:AraC-like DNA-binding protein
MMSKLLQSCHLGPELSAEHAIQEHFFIALLKGTLDAYSGYSNYHLAPGGYCIARKNHLLRYTKHKQDGEFQKIVIVFDESFLKNFQKKHPTATAVYENEDPIVFIGEDNLLQSFILSLAPYYTGEAEIDETFSDLKREELLLILLRKNPNLASVLFDFGAPQRIDLKEFMNRNFRFNISLDRFAFLTGRSLSTFKRDFSNLFNETPGQWLTRKRLEEAYFLISNQNLRPSDIYMNLGFEDFSHFSYAFKKKFGHSPSDILKEQNNS